MSTEGYRNYVVCMFMLHGIANIFGADTGSELMKELDRNVNTSEYILAIPERNLRPMNAVRIS